MVGPIMNRHELSKIYPKVMFPNQEAYEATIETFLEAQYRDCRKCDYFINMDFEGEYMIYGGVCKKYLKAIPDRKICPCEG